MTALVEICVDDVAGARLAEAAGAHRLELCAGLVEGGTTPSIGCVRRTLRTIHQVDLQVLIRPRGGDFLYSRDELDVMLADIEAIRVLATPPGVRVGFVIGALTVDGDVDVASVRPLIEACAGAPVTFHRAFDQTRDLFASLDVLAELGVDRVLTAGGRARAVEGLEMLCELAQRTGERRPIILAGGGVRADNVAALVAAGVREVHVRAQHWAESAMAFRRADVRLNAPAAVSDYTRAVTSGELIADVIRTLTPSGAT